MLRREFTNFNFINTKSFLLDRSFFATNLLAGRQGHKGDKYKAAYPYICYV
jgi:hypothetical protein